MFKNELSVKTMNGKSIVSNRYLNSNFWHTYGFKHYQRNMFGGNGYISVFDTYSRYTRTVNGGMFQTITIAYDKWNGKPAVINGFIIETVDDCWQTLVSYNSYNRR